MGNNSKIKIIANLFSRSEPFWWQLLLFFIFLRSFLCEQAFSFVGFVYLLGLLIICGIFISLNIKKIIFPSPLNYFVLLFTAAIFISLFFARLPFISAFHITAYMTNILIFYAISSLTETRKMQVIRIIVICAVVVSCYGLYQYFIGFKHTENYLLKNAANMAIGDYLGMLSKKRAFSTFCSPNLFASYLLMAFFITSGVLVNGAARKVRRKNIARELLLLLGIAVILVALLFTRSLGALFALMVTFIFYLLFRFFRFSLHRRPRWLNIKNLIFLVIFIALLVACLKFNDTRIVQLLDLEQPSNSLVQRLYYWQAAMRIIRDYFITGVGWRLFGLYYEIYRPEPANTTHYAHNVFLQLNAETGFFGLLAFLGIVAFVVQLGLDREKADQQGLRLGLLLAAVVFLVHNMVDISFYFGQVAFLWWATLGFLNKKAQYTWE